jgi:hypothetical protein
MVMTIQDLYTKYQIMPQLSLHMRRVAGVGQLILDGWGGEIDRDLTMRALLLHDMGNLVKFDLTDAGQKKFALPSAMDLPHWRNTQEEFWTKYGHEAHEATIAILKEIGQDDVVAVLQEDHVGYAHGYESVFLKQGWSARIVGYCDVRVTPSGVVPMKDRIADLQERYGRELSWYNFLYELENGIRGMTSTDLDVITEESVAPLLDELLTYTI